MAKGILLAKRPDVVLLLEKYALIPGGDKNGKFAGCAKQWARDGKPPYDTPEHQALAERLPVGWEELSLQDFDALMQQLQRAMQEKKKGKLDTPDIGGQRMLNNLLQIALLTILSGASFVSRRGLGLLPDTDEAEKKKAKMLEPELALHLINATNLFGSFFHTLTRTIRTTRANQETIARLLRLVSVLLILLMEAKDDEERLKHLVENFRYFLVEEMRFAETVAVERIAVGAAHGEKAERVSLYVRQARVALEQRDFEGFSEAVAGTLDALRVNKDKLLHDLRSIDALADMLQKALTVGMEDETNKITAISRAM